VAWRRSPTRIRCLVLLLPAVLLLAGCAGALNWQPQAHRVRKGETLYSIAWEYGLDWRKLARWNHLSDPSTIYPGEKIRLSPAHGGRTGWHPERAPGSTPPARTASRVSPKPSSASHPARLPSEQAGQAPAAADSIHWQWPVKGKIVEGFHLGTRGNKGVDIGGYVGEAVHAAASGKVVYSGSGLVGYGKLIIVKHTSDVLSAYAYNRRLYVQEGDRVSAGQTIADMGKGTDGRPMLHFEIRVGGNPVNPVRLLPGT